ncbi:MAG TPA: GAF domain-containing protein [Sphingomicrobium sp.]|nr:GAF domain-containing protein [Sphingomicrobium sp.]
MAERQAESIRVDGAVQADAAVQPCAFLLQLSPDWIVQRASENCHKLLGESHVTLIGEPLSRFIQADPLHDLRNLFSRLSGTTGTARAYRIRLTDDRPRFDIAFQLSDGSVILEGVPSADQGLGESFGAVGGLAAGLNNVAGKELMDATARRMRALTGFDRVTFLRGRHKATSSRSGVPFPTGANASLSAHLPMLIADQRAQPVAVFPRGPARGIASALFRAPSTEECAALADRSIAATMRIPLALDGRHVGEFRCAHVTPRKPNLEMHAAAELFAQMVAMRLAMLEGGSP